MAKNYDNLTTALILNETLLKLGVHILSTGYLENRAFYLTKVIKYDNFDFNHKMVKDKDGEEDGKKVITNLKEEASKTRA